MTDYVKDTDFKVKDGLPSGSANKIVRGEEIDNEFNKISAAIASKANTNSPTFQGTVVLPDVTITGDVTMYLDDADEVTIDGGNYP